MGWLWRRRVRAAAARSRDRGFPLALSDDDAPKEVLLGDAGFIGIG